MSDDSNKKMIPAKDVEAIVEREALGFLRSVGIDAKKLPTGLGRTPDYGWGKLGIEVTAVHDFSPQIDALDDIRRFLKNNSGHDYYVYTYSDTSGLQCKILRQQECQEGLSILRIKQHVSTYRKKIINKLDDKYYQGVGYEPQVVLMDFRTAPYDPPTLGTEIADILKGSGMNYPSLAGIVAAVSANPMSSVIENATYFYVPNPHANSRVKELDSAADVPASDVKIVPQQNELFMRNVGQESITLPAPAFVSWEEIRAMGLPV